MGRGEGDGALVALASLPYAPDAGAIIWQLCMDCRPGEATLERRLGALHAIVVEATHGVEGNDPAAEHECRKHLKQVMAQSAGGARDLAASSAAMLHERTRR